MLEQVRQASSVLSARAVARLRAEQAAEKRASARQRIHARALHPIDVPHRVRDPLLRRRSRVASVLAGLRLLAAALGLHLVGVVVLVAAGRLVPDRPRFAPAEPLTMRILDTPPPDLPAALAPAPEPSAVVAPEFPEPSKPTPEPPRVEPSKPKPKPAPKAAQLSPPPSEPATNDAEPAGSAEPIPLLGLSLESTVSGSGPAFVTGTSRMGQTPREATPSGMASKGPSPTGSGGVAAEAPGAQRVATRIPTRDEKLEKPRRLQLKEPAYPATLRAQGIEGDVLVTVNIDAAGVVQQAAVLRSSGHTEFDAAALSAARAEHFAPATRDGTPMPFTLSYTYHFRIEE